MRFTVVTGCSQGLGFHAVDALARAAAADERIVLACRSVDAARAAVDRIAASVPAGREKLVVLDTPLDLAELASVRAYAAALRAHLGSAGAPHGIQALVNNAGIGGAPDLTPTRDGYERIFATNHLGHFLLTTLLLPATVAADRNAPLRIVNVSSEVHDPANKTPLPDPKQHWPSSAAEYDRVLAGGARIDGDSPRDAGGRAYARSKACNVLYTYELARRTSGALPHALEASARGAAGSVPRAKSSTLPGASSVQVLAFNPGLMLDTGFAAGVAGPLLARVARTAVPVLRFTRIGTFLRSGATSGADLARIATPAGPALEVPSAAYYDGPRLHPSSAFTRSHDALTRVQGELWDHSVRWARLTPEELAAAGFPT